MIHVLTPIRKNEQCADTLESQTVECKRFTASCDLENRRDNEAHNRNELKQHVSEPYTVLMDADVVLTEPDTMERMVAMMDKYPFPAIAVDTKNRQDLARCSSIGHAVIALLIIRKEILAAINFGHVDLLYKHDDLKTDLCIRDYQEANLCLCSQVNMQIAQFTGFQIPYIRGLPATEIIAE